MRNNHWLLYSVAASAFAILSICSPSPASATCRTAAGGAAMQLALDDKIKQLESRYNFYDDKNDWDHKCPILQSIRTAHLQRQQYYASIPSSCKLQAGTLEGIGRDLQAVDTEISDCRAHFANAGGDKGGEAASDGGGDATICIAQERLKKQPFRDYQTKVRNQCRQLVYAFFRVCYKSEGCSKQRQTIPALGEPFGPVGSGLDYPVLLNAVFGPAPRKSGISR